MQSNNRRIARNTVYMYLRMGVTMIVQLYTSRIVLGSLGIVNYGIYNIVGSVIVMFTFISGPLNTATQRFFNYELGKNDGGEINKMFNLSLIAYAALTLLIIIALEIGGGWYVANRLNIPPGRHTDAMWVFQFSTISLIFMLLRTPFESLIIAYERMDFYAYLCIADVLLKLANAFSLAYFSYDMLRLYAFNQFVICTVITLCAILYCHHKFPKVRIRRVWDKTAFKSLMSFSGWTLLSSVTTMGATNGVNVLLNAFCGVAVNSAMGFATQVCTALNQFVTNFQVAFNPQIVKYCSSGDIGPMQSLAYRAAKISYLLLLMLVWPLFFNMDFILNVWLKEVPPYTGSLCIGLVIWSLLETLMAPLWISVTATGRIKIYHIVMSLIISCVFFLSWLCLASGYSPLSVVAVKCGIDVILIVARLLFTHKLLGFSIAGYLRDVIIPVSLLTIAIATIISPVSIFVPPGWLSLGISYASVLILFLPLAFLTTFRRDERIAITNMIRNKLQLAL